MKQGKQKEIQHALMWQQINEPGSEYCYLRYREPDYFLHGTVITIFDKQPTLVDYQIHCDKAWCTHYVQIQMQSGQDHQTLALTRDDQGIWHKNGLSQDRFERCVDVDLGITPATNTLPIRRLGLAVGETAEVDAAWVRFPQLSVEVLTQRYTHLSENRYRYESRGGTFVTEFEVDSWGMVLTYPNLWARVAAGSTL